jgi:hypothetical protein
MGFIIMDLDARNVIDAFSSEDEALAFVREAIDESGVAAVANWSLGRSDRSTPPVSGKALVERAQAVART